MRVVTVEDAASFARESVVCVFVSSQSRKSRPPGCSSSSISR